MTETERGDRERQGKGERQESSRETGWKKCCSLLWILDNST